MSFDKPDPVEDHRIVIRPEEIDLAGRIKSERSSRSPQDAWIVGGAIAAVVIILLIMVALFGSLSGSPQRTAGHSSHRTTATGTYWNELGAAIRSLVNEGNAKEVHSPAESAAILHDQIRKCQEAASRITRLSVLDVDSEAVEVGARMAELINELALLLGAYATLVTEADEFRYWSTSPEILLESFLRGFFGDPWGTSDEVRAVQKAIGSRHQLLGEREEAWGRRANEWQALETRTRAMLTARYGVEFPPLGN